jgi:hypothetical protein
MYDTGIGTCADFEVITPRQVMPDFVPARLWLPYGYWTLNDGSEVIYARDYLPLWRIHAGRIERLSPWFWIKGEKRNFNFAHSLGRVDWASGPARALALEHLDRHRVRGLPRLADAMPHLLEPGVESVSSAVERLRETNGDVLEYPDYARPNHRLAFG